MWTEQLLAEPIKRVCTCRDVSVEEQRVTGTPVGGGGGGEVAEERGKITSNQSDVRTRLAEEII